MSKLLLTLLFIPSFLSNSWYKIIVSSFQNNESSVELYPGIYSPIKVQLIPTSKNSYPLIKTALKLSEDSKWISLTPSLDIDTSLSLTYKIYIGISCEIISSDFQITTSFIGEDLETFEYQNFTVNVKSSSGQIDVKLIGENFPSFGYGVYYIDEEVYNIEKVEFTVKSSNKNIKSTNLLLPEYTGQKDSRYVFGKIYLNNIQEKEHRNDNQWNVNITLESINKCFVPKQGEFNINFNDEIDVSNTQNKSFTISLNKATTANYITFSFSDLIELSLVSCVIVPNLERFPETDVIVSQPLLTEEQYQTMRYFQYFAGEESDRDFYFYGLNTRFPYKIKCVYRNNVNDEEYLTENTVETMFSLPSTNDSMPSINVYCLDWFVKSVSDNSSKSLEQAWYKECINTLYSFEFNRETDYIENGCLHCEIRNAQEFFETKSQEYADVVSVCIRGSPTCATANTNSKKVYEEFYKKTENSEKIRLLEENVELFKLITEEDKTFSNDPSSYWDISVLFSNKTLNQVEIEVSTNVVFPYRCHFSVNRTDEWDTNLGSVETVMKEGTYKQKVKLDIPIETTYSDGNLYNVDIKCKHLPDIDESITYINQTLMFMHKDYESICPWGQKTDNSVCWQYAIHKLPQLQTPLELTDQSETIASMRQNGYFGFFIYFTFKQNDIWSESDDFKKIRWIAEITELVVNFQTDRLPVNEAYRQVKYNFLYEILFTLNNWDPLHETTEQIKQFEKYKDWITFYITNTADTFLAKKTEDYEMYISLLTERLKAAEISQLNAEENPYDNFVMSASFLVNLKQWFTFLISQNNIIEYNKKTGYLTEKRLLTIRNEITNYWSIWLKYEYSIEYENIKLLTKKITGSEEEKEIEMDIPEYNIKITIPTTAIQEKILGTLGGIGVVVYHDNPFIVDKVNVLKSKTFSLHVYTEDGVVDWTGLSTEQETVGNRYVVQFTLDDELSNDRGKPFCYRYDDKTDDLVYTGIITEYVSGEDNIIRCYSDKLGEILLGYLDEHGDTRQVNNEPGAEKKDINVGLWVLIITFIVFLIIVISFVIFKIVTKNIRKYSHRDYDLIKRVSFSGGLDLDY